MKYKRLAGNNLLTINKDLLLKTKKKNVPIILYNKTDFAKFYYTMYTVEIIEGNIIIRLLENVKAIDMIKGVKFLTLPNKIRRTVSYTNIHIPQKIINEIKTKEFIFTVERAKKIVLEPINKIK